MKRCDNCIFSRFVIGPDRPQLLCPQKLAAHGIWTIRPLDASCQDFYPKTIVRLNLALPRRIPLTQGKFALVDPKKYYWLTQFLWQTERYANTCYAVTKHNGKRIKMHRLITDAPDHLVVDHIDHNGLNNCLSNLRLCTFKQNCRNARKNKPTSSIYKGVNWSKSSNKWMARIGIDNKRLHLGYFKDQADAARAYDKKAAELFGEFACLNFPNS